jgi:hypothetical protein
MERDFEKDYDYIPAVTEGEWRLPPGLKRSLPFYFRRKWVSFGEPIPLFEHLHKCVWADCALSVYGDDDCVRE